MSGAARGASDITDVVRGDSETPGAGHCRPQRKRTAKAMKLMRQEDDVDWEEE
jgi:hypothetical protein